MRLSRDYAFAGVFVLVVVAAIAVAVREMGSPVEQRARRIDERRVRDLELIERQVSRFRTSLGRLPASLDELRREVPGIRTAESEGTIRFADPATNAPYEYRIITATTYELCAVFERESATPSDWWPHRAGRQCFRRP